MSEQKLKAYRFVSKMRYKKTNKIVMQQFSIVAYNLKEAKELFEFDTEHASMFKYWELIEISEIKRDFRKKWDSPYIRHYYEMLTGFKKRAEEENK